MLSAQRGDADGAHAHRRWAGCRSIRSGSPQGHGTCAPESKSSSRRDCHEACPSSRAPARFRQRLPNESRLSGGRLRPPCAQHLPYPQVSSPSEPPPGVARPLQALARQRCAPMQSALRGDPDGAHAHRRWAGCRSIRSGSPQGHGTCAPGSKSSSRRDCHEACPSSGAPVRFRQRLPNESRLSGGPAAHLPGAYDSNLLAKRQLSVRRPCPAAVGTSGRTSTR